MRVEGLAFYPGLSLSPSELSRPGRATPVSRLSLDREKMSRPRQLGKIVSPPPSSPSPPPSSSPDEKGSSSLSESIGRHEQKPWSRMYVRARVYSVHSSLRLYVSGRTRKRVGVVERGEKAGERWNGGWERRERRSGVKERLIGSRPEWAGGGKRAIGWRGGGRGGGGNRRESEGDGKLCELVPAHTSHPILRSLSPSILPHPSPRTTVPRALEMKPNFSLLPRLTLLATLQPLTLPLPLSPPFQPPPLACTVPFRSLPARHSSLYPMSESKGVLWG